MSQAQEKDLQRADRLRDNKRRHRLRQKEYVADLERRLGEARERGIQATKEVQTAAQRVIWENSRLRQILHDQGLDNVAIDALVYKDGPFKPDAAQPPKAAARPAIEHHTVQEAPKGPNADSENIEYNPTGSSTDSLASCKIDASSRAEARSEEISPDIAPAPCKLLTILAGNPNADITQTPVVINEKNECEETDALECSRAREMLMLFATTEEKLDDIARALEEGCVKNAEGGGCRVKKDVMWETLDRVCD